MFEQLTSKFEDLFYRIRNKGKLSPGDLDKALREIKLALLEAELDHNLYIVNDGPGALAFLRRHDPWMARRSRWLPEGQRRRRGL